MTRHIYVLSPAGAVLDKKGFRRGIQRLESLGYTVRVDEAALARHTRFAGDDTVRLAAIERAAQSGADAVMLGRGGYGLSRLMPQLPFDAIYKSIAQGCKWIGYSDFTALQMALLAHSPPHSNRSTNPTDAPAPISNGQTWAGPLVAADLGREEPDEITLSCFSDLMEGSAEGTGWQLKPSIAQKLAFDGSIEDALLWGGNLCVLTSLIGTPYFPPAAVTQGGILFIEDVAEHPYRIERMLLQLFHAGVLQQQKAVLLGQFSDYRLGPLDKGYKLEGVIGYLQSLLPHTPLIPGLPFGHGETKVCLPVGAKVDLHRSGRDIFMLWEH